eukprot:CAMPEP_0198290366 /NCGR_PEP_ID=MMETSP1449-20131203/8273_1 /TAXON_ID=420275 /ORGANISM="Attheya septentrionalis, Strain CCMP2084" /LENGTH=868 /DNA_ID=CAMNT_0043988871 /DNA_START=282 /DNA_END=2888 /DNA_ORIENTATION=+
MRLQSQITRATALCLVLEALVSSRVILARISYECDSDAIKATTRASSLMPNTIHKICPGTHGSSTSLGQPTCGDGTPFSFFFTSPPQRYTNTEKVLIEFQGGGACWDSDTCEDQADYLTFPQQFNNFVGYSCTEANALGVTDTGGQPIDMMCDKQMDNLDFQTYNTIVVPYCTQDAHMGDSMQYYNGNDEGYTTSVKHHGAHNMMAVLRWVFKNFPAATHIALTGCGAGATGIPIAYDLLNKHYNSRFKIGRSIQISTMLDSPLFLTPQNFLDYSLDIWNPWTLLKNINFNFKKYRKDESYPIRLLDHIMKRGHNSDKWGIVTHTYDATAIAYFESMTAADDDYNNNDDNNDDDSSSVWYNTFSKSIQTLQKKHKNLETYIINAQGHCSFGLYYPLLQDGFSTWAGSIFYESSIMGRSKPTVRLFLASILMGFGIVAGVLITKRRRQEIELDSNQGLLDSQELKKEVKWRATLLTFFNRFKSCPITAGYFVATSFYFWTMILTSGFAHPLNNPSLGPSAQTLSAFGINNPTLIVKGMGIYRLLTSTFLCSGLLTYGMVGACMWKCIRHLEKQINSNFQFSILCFAVATGFNIIYALIGNGASCGSLAFVLGLSTFSIVTGRKRTTKGDEAGFPQPYVMTSMFLISTIIFFPFNSWVMLMSAVGVGGGIAHFGYNYVNDPDAEDRRGMVDSPIDQPMKLNPQRMSSIFGAYALMFLILLLNRQRPNPVYMNSYFTGCELIYSTQVSDVVNNYYASLVDDDDDYYNAANDDGGNRRLSGDSSDSSDGDDDAGSLIYFGNNLCAELCVPHSIYRPAYWGVGTFTDYNFKRGTCEGAGYETHLADKTFKQASYKLDVEVFSSSNYDDNYGYN